MISKLKTFLILLIILVILLIGIRFSSIDKTSPITELQNSTESLDNNSKNNTRFKHKDQNVRNTDTDGDNITDYIETEMLGTSPTNEDTDNDGLSDGMEYNRYDTNPIKPDTDGDGLEDGKEVDIGTNPTESDTDSDGIIDKKEVNKYDSDPTSKYTVKNGLNDSEQLSYGLNPSENPKISKISDKIKSIRTKSLYLDTQEDKDSDNDGYTDSLEEDVTELNKNKKDVVVHITWVKGTDPTVSPLLNVRESYLESPVDNGRGINTIFYIDGSVNASHEIDGSYLNNYYKKRYDDTISHYVLFTENVTKGGREINGITPVENPAIAIASNKKERLTGWALMHEMGHSLGILKSDYDGVDANNDINSYPSVMNYKSLGSCLGNLSHCYRYSNGVGNNDWKTIEDKLESGSVVPNRNYNPS